MANWKALTWSESIKTGKQQARHVLTVLCMKCNDDYLVFSAASRIAGFCEISTRRLYDWLDYLEQHEFITVIRRVRPNGSEAKPITLLNVPEAPHLNGVLVTLDYNGKYLYPRHPDALRAAGIRWVAGGEEGRVHPSHEPVDNSEHDEAQGDELSGCQHDSLATCVNCTEDQEPQVSQHDELSGRQHDSSSPHGGDSSSPPKHSPTESFPSRNSSPPPVVPHETAHADEPEQPSNEGEGEIPPGGNDWKQQRAGRFLGDVVGKVPRELADGLSTDDKHRLVALVLAAWDCGIGNAELRDALTNVHGTKHLGQAWPAKLQRLIDNAPGHGAHSALPSCSTCRAAAGEPPSFRNVLAEPGNPSSREVPCPDCRQTEAPSSINEAPSAPPAAS